MKFRLVEELDILPQYIKSIVNKIHSKVEQDRKDPTGNQNCQLCTWCFEAQMRGIDILPRPVYSPRDIIFNFDGCNIVNSNEKIKFNSIEDLEKIIKNNQRYYCHVNWSGSQGGHEFILLNYNNQIYIIDSQAGTTSLLYSDDYYFKDINFSNSFICRLDNKELNTNILKYNDNKYLLQWNEDEDTKYLRDNGMSEQLVENIISQKLYRLSQNNLDGKVLKPSIPDNYFTRNNYEDNTTPRVCFAPSIDKCLMALSQKCGGMKLYVYIPENTYNIYKPLVNEVPDSKITDEVWITTPVKVRCIGQIEVIGDAGKDGHKFKYGNKEAELYDWNWKWLEKFDEGFLLESKHKSIISDFYQPKGSKNLAQFKQVSITKELQKKYGKIVQLLAEADKDEFGIAWIDKNNNLVGYCMANDYGWLTALEVTKDYKGYGLSDQILKYAINNFNVNKLGVYKDNEIAIRLYKKNGFVEVPAKVIGGSGEKDMIYMTNDRSLIRTNESALLEFRCDFSSSDSDEERDAKVISVVRENLKGMRTSEIDTADYKYFVFKYKNGVQHLTIDGETPGEARDIRDTHIACEMSIKEYNNRITGKSVEDKNAIEKSDKEMHKRELKYEKDCAGKSATLGIPHASKAVSLQRYETKPILSEFTLLESDDESHIEKGHKQKDTIKLSDLEMKVRQRNDEGKSKVYSWYDDGKFVGTILIDTVPASDGNKWFGSLRVNKKYRGHSIGDQIIDFAIKKGASALAVYKDNEIAIHMYEKHGFKISKDRTDDEFYFMYL